MPVGPRTATIRWYGVPIRGRMLSQRDDGNYIFRALEKHPRFETGDDFLAKPSEISWDDEA